MKVERISQFQATPQSLWAEFSNPKTFHEWFTEIGPLRYEGDWKQGTRFQAVIQDEKVTHRPISIWGEINTYEKDKRFSFKSSMFSATLFLGTHLFELHPKSDGGTELRHRETFTGLLAPFLYWFWLRKRTPEMFQRIHENLRARVEKS